MLKIFVYSIVLLLLVIAGFYLFRLSNPYSFLMHCDSEEQGEYMSFYENILSKKKFDYLLVDLINSNDIRTLNVIAEYCKENKKCDKLDLLEQKTKELYQLPNDSSWITQVDFSYSRKNSVSMLYLPNNLMENMKKLRMICP